MKKAELDLTGKEDVNDAAEMAGWGVEEAQERNKRDASKSPFSLPYKYLEAMGNFLIDQTGLTTQLALAYAIHKSFIFVRVPLAAAVTPRVVKMLRGWGWDIGKKTTKAAKAAKRIEVAEKIALKKAKKQSK